MVLNPVPSSSNNYLVDFRYPTNQGNFIWKNHPWAPAPHKIVPFAPRENKVLVESFNKSINSRFFNSFEFENSCAGDNFVVISINLDPKDLVNFSEVSKFCYLATKTETIWYMQLQKFFPNVVISNKKRFALERHYPFEMVLSPEQQFQIVFHRINEIEKPYRCQIKFLHKELHELYLYHSNKLVIKLQSIISQMQRGSLDSALLNYQESIPEKIRDEIHRIHYRIIRGGHCFSNDDWSCEEAAFLNQRGLTFHSSFKVKAINKFILEKTPMIFKHFEAEMQSGGIYFANIKQQLDRCQKALELIKDEFNNQEIFDFSIKSLVLKHNNCVVL